ncbi:hypothetical protein [Mycolicibacterium sphagni]|uniref:Uncharacterized protein n=1 Tax=Mycolicibacterium sphagni TaxID=1786 RepID=A0A255DXH8_9MYCO|nr:hypothetical protein [Mycolicibacterium sphagni]OYN80443.1 hypothetical protein CG716_09995 [Mycolicibacterium sphagni]
MSEFPRLRNVVADAMFEAYRHDANGADAQDILNALCEACTIRTVEELDALPLDSVVVDRAGIPRTKRGGDSHMPAGWTHAGRSPLRSHELADGRAMLLIWHPAWERP